MVSAHFCPYMQFKTDGHYTFACGFPYTVQESTLDLFNWLQGNPCKLLKLNYLHRCYNACDFDRLLRKKLEMGIVLISIDCRGNHDKRRV